MATNSPQSAPKSSAKHWWAGIASVTILLLVIGILQPKNYARLFQNKFFCVPYARPAMEADLAAARQKWAQIGSPADYTITVSWARNHGGNMATGIGDVRVTYRANQAISAIWVEGNSEMLIGHDPIDELFFKGYNSMAVAARFEWVALLIQGAHQPPCYSTLEISYDPLHGYITEIKSDIYGVVNNPYHCPSNPGFKGCPVSAEIYSFAAHDFYTTTATATEAYP